MVKLTVFAVDPGISTGWARGEVHIDDLMMSGGDVGSLIADGALVCEAGEDLALSDDGTKRGAKALGLDPYRIDRGELYLRERESAARLWELMGGADVLVVEDFTVYAGKAGEVSAGGAVPLAPVRVGSMLAMAAEIAVMEVAYQMASLAKTTVTDERLNRWGAWTKGSAHARDASRHLLTYLRRYAAGEV